MDIFARKTPVVIIVFSAIIAASFAITPNIYADIASAPTTTSGENSSVASSSNDSNKTATFSLPEIADGKYSFGESVFDGMTDDEVDALVGDLPRGHWVYVDVKKTRKSATLKDGKIQVVEVPYTVKVRTEYVLEDYLITYNNLVEGSSAPETKTFKYDTPTFDLQPASDTEDWLFEGWYTGENGTGTRVTQITKNTKTDIILYANYIPNFYIVRFSSNGGDGIVNDIKVKRGIEVTLPASPMKKNGYNFVGWNTNPDRTGNALADQACINDLTTGNDIALYAQYDPITYLVSFNANGGTGTMQNQGIVYDTSKNLTLSVMKKDGMRFCGWNTAADGSGEWYADAGVVRNLTKTKDKVVALYAQYEDPASPNPFANMTGTVFVGDTVYEDFNPMTTSYNMEGMPQQISISNAPANFAVESIETSDIATLAGTNTVEKSQQTAVKVRYYGEGESQERIYKFNWDWVESMGSSFGQEITTVPVFKHGVSYPAGSYLIGSDIDSGSYIIEYEGNATAISLIKKGSENSSAMKNGRSYDLSDGDKIEAEVPFYLILEFDTSSIKNSELVNSVVQESNEASLRGDGMYVEVDPIQKVVPSVINEPTYDLTSQEGMVNNSNTEPEKTQVTNDVIEEVKKEDTPEYIQNEIDARTNTTYEIVDTNTVQENNTGDATTNDVAPNDVRLTDYYGTWQFESFTTDTQEKIEKAERGDLVSPQYSDLTYSYSDDNKDNIKTIDDFLTADNKIEIKESGTVIQRFKYANDDKEYKSYAEWEKIENNGKIEGIRISAFESNYVVTATIMNGKLVFDKTSSYAAIFKKIAEASSQSSGSSSGSGTSLGTQSVETTFGFISPYSVFGYVWKEIQQTVDPDPKTNTNTNTESGVIAPITVTEPGPRTNSAGPGIKNTNENNNPRSAEPSTDTDTPKPSTSKENGNSGNDTPGTSIETQSPSSPNPRPDGTWQAINSNSGSPARTPSDQNPSVNASTNQTRSSETTKVDSGTQPQPSSQPGSVTSSTTVSPPTLSAPAVTPDKVIDNGDGTKTEITTGNDGIVTYTKINSDGEKTTWVVDSEVTPENLLPTNTEITTTFEKSAQTIEGISPETIKVIADNLKDTLDNAGGDLSNGIANVAISNAIEAAKKSGLISDEQARALKSSAKKGNDELFKETEEQAIRDFVETLPEGGTEDGEVLTTENGEFVPMPRELRSDRIENSYQNYNTANAPELTPRNNAANKNMQVKGETGALDDEGIIAHIASNDVLRAGVVGLPVLIIVLIAAFMFTRSDERE